jgi:serine/threonine protein kinase
MQKDEWSKIKELFHQMLNLPVNEREKLLAEQNDFVRSEVLGLIASHENANNFIAESVAVEFGLGGNSLVGRQIGNYKLLEIIGAGGMGTVFRAEKEDFGKNFAVKLIKRGMDTDAILQRFQLERQILSRLEHPNIARLLDGGTTDDGLPYFVMEYVEGLPVTKFCDEHQFGIKERLELFRQICGAVKYAHQNLIVHRDLKPSNILVTKEGIPKLLDFGIAKLLNPEDSEDTATQARMFTPEYASPEQLSGLPITTASDVYSLGVVLYELLSGQRPFKSNRKGYQEIVNLILTDEPIRPSAVSNSKFKVQNSKSEVETLSYDGRKTKSETPNPKSKIQNLKSLRGDLDNIILKALRKEPERRYQSVQELSEDIRRHLVGLPVTATADSSFYRFSKFVQRHQQGVTFGSLIAVIILIVSGFAVWQGIVANRERQKAEKRLAEIRNVAKSLMNETNDSLAKIPGNVTVQKALAEKSVAMLDSLASEETNDATLLTELADAYTKLANIQLWAFREFDKAVENLEKSKTIYNKILQKTPNDIEVRRKVYAMQMRYIEALQDTNRREEMFRIGTDAVENRQKIISLEPENPSNYANLAAMYGWFGDKNLLFGRNIEAVEYYRKGVEIIDRAIEKQIPKNNSAEAKAELARLYFIKGWLTKGAGEDEKAIEIFQNSSNIARQVFAENAGILGNFTRVVGSYEEIALIYEKRNDFQSALNSYLTARKLMDEGSKNREIPEYGDLLYLKCFYSVFAGKMSAKLGNKNDARQYFTEGETACRQNIAQDANDSENVFESQPYIFEIADFYVTLGEKEKAVKQLLELSEKLQNMLDKNQSDLTAVFSLAEIFEKIGDINHEQSRELYGKSVKLWRDNSKENSLVQEEAEKMNRVIGKLENVKK